MEKNKRALQRFITVLIAVTLAVLAGLNSGCKSGKEIPQLGGENKYNLLVITVEGLRADRLGCYGFNTIKTPNMDRLADTGVRFENCYSPAPLTLPSLSTVFTGRDPVSHGVRSDTVHYLKDSETTLAELLGADGFQTHAVVSSMNLMAKFGLNQGFQYYDDSLHYRITANRAHEDINAEKTFFKFKRWLDSHLEEKFFSWVHFHDPHFPYAPPADFAGIYEKDPYSGEVSYVDLYVGKILKELEDKKLLDKTLVVLAGNYGQGFGEHDEFGSGVFCYNEHLNVPLIFSNPVLFKTGKKIGRRVGLIDVMPTLLHLYGVNKPDAVKGRSIAHWLVTEESPGMKETSPPYYFESLFANTEYGWAPIQGVINGSYKYIRLLEPEMYDLENDKGETENLASSQKALGKTMAAQVAEFTATDGKDTAGLTDPRRGIKLINKLRSVKKLLNTPGGDLSEAASLLDALEKKFPDVPMPLISIYRSELLVKTGRAQEAEAVLKKAVETFGDSDQLKINLALFYFNAGNMEQAKAICTGILSDNPRFTPADVLLREIYRKRGKVDRELIASYEAGIKAEPFNALLQVEYGEIQAALGKKDTVLQTVSRLMEYEGLMNEKDNLDIITRMGIMLLRLGEFDRTITLCRHVTSLGHESTQVLNQMGKAYSGKGNLLEAEKAYNKALEMDKTNDLTLSNLGTLYLQMFRLNKNRELHAKAIEFYTRALETNPKLVTALNGLAVAYSFSGEPQKAVTFWEKALEISPEFSNTYFNLGITYLRMKNKPAALKVLNLLKERLYDRLSSREQQQLDSLLQEASK